MTVQDVQDRIRRAAGVRRVQIPVFVVEHPRAIPPQLRRERRKMPRHVRVSVAWLRKKRPEWLDVIRTDVFAARMLGTEPNAKIVSLREIPEKERTWTMRSNPHPDSMLGRGGP